MGWVLAAFTKVLAPILRSPNPQAKRGVYGTAPYLIALYGRCPAVDSYTRLMMN